MKQFIFLFFLNSYVRKFGVEGDLHKNQSVMLCVPL